MTVRSSPRLKRALDLAVAIPALAVTSPAQALIALLIAREMGRPVFFRQLRPGLHGVPFELVKFRTMRPVDDFQSLVSDGDRLTKLGRFLRATSLDELPTLWNVVRGDMSLVGPRPLLMEYLDRYTDEQLHRHDVRPGVTGLAQVSGRNAITWDERLRLDVEYANRWSLGLDLHILLATIGKVLRREGVSNPNHATMPPFLGTDHRDFPGPA